MPNCGEPKTFKEVAWIMLLALLITLVLFGIGIPLFSYVFRDDLAEMQRQTEEARKAGYWDRTWHKMPETDEK